MSGKVTWYGVNGSEWVLFGDLASPVRLTTAGLVGMGMPTLDFNVQDYPLLDGQRVTGVKRKARTLTLPLRFRSKVQALQAAWWESLGTDGEYGSLEVTAPDGTSRRIACRFTDDGNPAYRLFPWVLSDQFTITLVADDPWWRGDAVSTSYSYDPSAGVVPFFGPHGNDAPPFNLIPATSAGSVEIYNPGNVDAWPEWIIDTNDPAGIDSVLIDVYGDQIELRAINLPSGGRIVISTDPTQQTVYQGEQADWAPDALQGETLLINTQLNQAGFAPIGAGYTNEVTVTLGGVGTITGIITPTYRRAFS